MLRNKRYKCRKTLGISILYLSSFINNIKIEIGSSLIKKTRPRSDGKNCYEKESSLNS